MKLFGAAAVLCDMDGTLVDSSQACEALWRLWCRRAGVDEATLIASSHGVPTHTTMQKFAPHLPLGNELAWFHANEMRDETPTREIAGARAFVESLAVPWAVVTAADQPLARKRLTSAGVPLPKVIVGADDVREGKPSPEGYLLAAQKLGVNIANCIVIEDTPTGIEAARRAGVKAVIARVGTYPKHALHADLHVDDYRSGPETNDGVGERAVLGQATEDVRSAMHTDATARQQRLDDPAV